MRGFSLVSDSCSRMFPFPLLSAMQEDRPRTGIVSVSGKQTRNQTPRTTLCHTPPCFPIPHFASNSPFRRRSVCGQLSADHVAPSRQSESHYADSRSPGATACQLAAKERSEQCLAFFGHTATGSPAGRKNSNGTRSCAPTSAHCSSLKFMPHKTGGSSFADNTSGIATA